MDERDLAIWAMFYSSIMGFQYHPGTRVAITDVQGAEIADRMFSQYMLRKRGDVWLG